MSFESLADLLKLNQDACNWISVQRNTQLRSRDDFAYWLPVSLQKITDFAQIGMNDGARILRRYRHIPLDELVELSESNYYYTCYSTLGQKETVALSACSAVFNLTAMLFELRLETAKALGETYKHAGKFTQPEPKRDAPYGPDWIEQFQRSEFWWPMRSMSFCPEFDGVSIIELQKASQMELRLWWRTRTEHGQSVSVGEGVEPAIPTKRPLELPKRPKGNRPKRSKKDCKFKLWEIEIVRQCGEGGAQKAWDKNKDALNEVGVKSLTEFKAIHERSRKTAFRNP